MWHPGGFFNDRYHGLEIGFFVVYFILFPVISSLEYFVYESTATTWDNSIPERLIYGLTSMIPAWICYRFVIQAFLFRKRYLEFAGFFLVYLTLHRAYSIGVYWGVSKLSFLPSAIVTRATLWYANNNAFQHIVSMYALRDLLVLSALAYFIRSARQDKQIGELKSQHVQAELNYLKLQMQPHFFFNTLNNIYALTLQRSEKAAPLVAKHADIMRHILYESSDIQVSLKKEIDFIRNYVEVESMHYAENMDIAFETQGVTDNAVIESMLLLPFIENMFKHGMQNETAKGYIHIIISLVEDELFVELRNSKPAGTESRARGIGLQNVMKRLAILYPGKHDLQITDNLDSYELRFSLTLHLNGQLYHR